MEKTLRKVKQISSLKIQEDVQDLFLVKYISMQEARDGRSYLNIVLADKSGEIECRVWKDVNQIFSNTKKGDFALVNGKVNVYQKNKQIIISSLESVNIEQIEDFKENDYIMSSDIPADQMFDDLVKKVEQLDEVYIKDLLLLILNDREIKKRLLVWPAAKTIHHAYKSGLLEHILSCVNLSIVLSDIYKVNKSYVVAGAILHDLAKIYEMTSGNVVEYTDEGRLVGHLVKGVEIIDRFSFKIPNFPNSVRIHLKHIIVSHHGTYEYGSPKLPQTSEAMLLHLIDYMDSKMSSFEISKKMDQKEPVWTGFVKHLERPVYKKQLPSFRTYKVESEKTKKNEVKTPRKTVKEKPITQNLGKLLQNFEVSEKE